MGTQSLDVEILESKEFEKLAKHWGEKVAKEFIQKSTPELKEVLASKQVDRRNAIADVESNEKYKAAKSVMKDFNASKRDVLAPIDAAIAVIARVLSARG